jgi:hypothetical protein
MVAALPTARREGVVEATVSSRAGARHPPDPFGFSRRRLYTAWSFGLPLAWATWLITTFRERVASPIEGRADK